MSQHTSQSTENRSLSQNTRFGNSNPSVRQRVTWTIGSFDENDEPTPEPTPHRTEPAATNTLKVAQAILAALDPFPDAYQAVLQALRATFPLPEFFPAPAGP